MAFVIEKIPENMKQLHPYINIDLSWYWSVDYERNVFMAIRGKVGGPYEGTQQTKYYVLHFRNTAIAIAADPLPVTFSEVGSTMHWRVHQIDIPSSLSTDRDFIIQITREAFTCVGEFFDGSRFAAVDVQFDLVGKS